MNDSFSIIYYVVGNDFGVPLVFAGILFSQTPTVVLTRFASKKSGGSSKNLGGKSAGRRYGYKKQDGTFFTIYIDLVRRTCIDCVCCYCDWSLLLAMNLHCNACFVFPFKVTLYMRAISLLHNARV